MVLFGYFFGRQASRHAIGQLDTGKLGGDTPEKPGGIWATAVNWLGILSLISFTDGMYQIDQEWRLKLVVETNMDLRAKELSHDWKMQQE